MDVNHISINKKERERKAQNLKKKKKKKKSMKPPTGTQRGFWKFFCPLPSMTKHHARCVGGYENKQEPRPCPQKLFQLPRWTCVQLTSSGQHFPNQQPGSKA